MLTFKQWLVRQYGTSDIKIKPKITTNDTNSRAANTTRSNS